MPYSFNDLPLERRIAQLREDITLLEALYWGPEATALIRLKSEQLWELVRALEERERALEGLERHPRPQGSQGSLAVRGR